MSQSCGVCGFKYVIKLCYRDAVAAFEPACQWHDKAYASVDWDVGTADIDLEFYRRCHAIAGDDKELQQDALTFYKAARRWGQMRQGLYRVGVCW